MSPVPTGDPPPARGPVVAVVGRRGRRRRPGSSGPILLLLFVVVMVGVGRLTEPAAHGRGEIVLEPASSAGPHPFTASVATGTAPTAPAPASGRTTSATSGSAATLIATSPGSQPGLYGGTRGAPSCDAQKLIEALQKSTVVTAAFAEVEGISPPDIPSFAGGLTGVVLRSDTRVTDHGFIKDHPSVFQAVLEAGTRVMVDHFGVPRVRCAGGTPLGPPVAVVITPRYVGARWPGFAPGGMSVVTAATQPMATLVLVDGAGGPRFSRPVATGGQADTDAPAAQAAR
jgi:Domain of unknown function (DUF6777)